MTTFIVATVTLLIGLWIGRYTGYQKGITDGVQQCLAVAKKHNAENPVPKSPYVIWKEEKGRYTVI
jgi:hypothetical protein